MIFTDCVKTKLEYTVNENGNDGIPVIVVAAGNATRMQGIDKQMLLLGGEPVLVKTLKAFQKSPFVSKIIVVTKKESVLKIQNLCGEYLLNKVTDVAEGGTSRHESVLCGIARLSKDEGKVLIHDGARPFVKQKMIEECVKSLEKYDGCLVALKVSDTVKKADANGLVEKTIDRNCLYLAQTPQGVDVKMYLEASNKYAHTEFTDDASVLERDGKNVVIIDGDRTNIKITTREDIILANAIKSEDDTL